MKTLFKNAKILVRKDGRYEVLEDACLLTDGAYIAYVGKDAPKGENGAEIRDMRGKLLMPGLVNAHGHASMTLLRGAGSGLPLQRWLNEAIFPVEAKMIPEDIAAGTGMAILEMLAGGTTLFSEMYDFPQADAEIIERSGMKANLCRVGLCFDPSLAAADWPRTQECIDLVRGYRDPSDRVRAEFCLHSEYLTTENFARAIAEANRSLHACVQVHVSETKAEHEECIARHGKTPIAYFEEIGLLEAPVYAAHCVWVTEADMRIMARRGVSMVHNPSSNMKLGSGFAPVAAAMAAGVNVALGTDGCASNNNLNMFEEMHLAALIHKGVAQDPTVLSVDQILDMATVNGARAMGRPDTGEIAVGKKADLIALSLDAPHLQPQTDIPALLVYSAQASDVCMTMVDGRILYEDGEYKTLDPKEVGAKFREAVGRLL